MNQLSYEDFELKIERDGNNFHAKVLESPFVGAEASGTFSMPFTDEKLELLLLKIGNTRANTRGFHTPELEAASELGGKLFDAVFQNNVGECLKRSLDKVKHYKKGLRIKLRLQDVPELADLPWEFLFDRSTDRFFAHSRLTPIIRYVEMTESILPLEVNLPLEILVMISSPTDLESLDVKREKSQLRGALKLLSNQGLVHVDWLEKATLPALQQRLNKGEYHIFHFIGHGRFDRRKNEGVLVLEDEHGRGWEADARQIGTLLHDHQSLRLAVLNSCEGARNSLTDPFAGVATHLIRQGVPSVVAMQFEITDTSAIEFARQFYEALAGGFPVDAAVSEARKAIYNISPIEWGTPVLYMRSTDGVLFNLAHTPIVKKEQPETHKTTPIPADYKISHHFTKPTIGTVTYNGHNIEINDTGYGLEIIKYEGREVSKKFSFSGGNHIFRVLEDGGEVQYIVSLSRNSTGCEVTRNGIIIYTNLLPQAQAEEKKQPANAHFTKPTKGTVTYNGHNIEISDTGYGPEIIKYDGKEVSRKISISGAHHIFRVFEDGEEVQYVVILSNNPTGCEVSRNGEIIFTNL